LWIDSKFSLSTFRHAWIGIQLPRHVAHQVDELRVVGGAFSVTNFSSGP
jgi:hypothetical protein